MAHSYVSADWWESPRTIDFGSQITGMTTSGDNLMVLTNDGSYSIGGSDIQRMGYDSNGVTTISSSGGTGGSGGATGDFGFINITPGGIWPGSVWFDQQTGMYSYGTGPKKTMLHPRCPRALCKKLNLTIKK